MSRYSQYKLQAITRRRTFIAADNLVYIDALFDIVAEQVENIL